MLIVAVKERMNLESNFNLFPASHSQHRIKR